MIDTALLIGPRLKLARKNARLSQKELAALCGIGQSHVSALERNARAPSIEMLAGLADALSVTSHWLLGGDLALCTALDIQPTEWQALRSLKTPHPISK